jgi:tRNA(adenine34) deaminase
MYMAAALAEARKAAATGQRPRGAVAVLDEAMVASGHDQVSQTGDPTAHAVVVALREAAKRLGRSELSGLVVFATNEPCAMCVGALLASDVDGLVYALDDPDTGATGPTGPAEQESLRRRLRVVSGIMQAEAAELAGAGNSRRALPTA